MAEPVTVDYLSGVATDRSQMLSLVAGMTALATMLGGWLVRSPQPTSTR
jgi:hypothetical protein